MTSHASEHEQALRWLIRNRRPDISVEQAVRVMRMAIYFDHRTMVVLKRIAAEEEAAQATTKFNWRQPAGRPRG